METTLPQDPPPPDLSQQARTIAESRARSELKCDVLAEVAGHQSLWTECRVLFKQHMRIWQDFTTVSLGTGTDGTLAGWMVEKRKADCGPEILPDAEVEKHARAVKQIPPEARLHGIRRIPLNEEQSFAVVTLAGPARTDLFEVFVNHTTSELIGFLPSPVGKVAPVPTDDDAAKAAEELAWTQIQAELAERLDPEAASQARQVLKLTPTTALRDEAGRCIRLYRLWRFYSTCDVSIDERSKEIVSWYLEAFQSDAPERHLNEAAAVQSARPELKAVDGVQGPQVSFSKAGEDEKATVHWWHAENGINVEGDQTTVLLNATTGKIYSVARKWRVIPRELLKPPAVNEEQALRAADLAVKRAPAQPRGKVLGQNIIQVALDPEQPSPVRDVLVWRVGYTEAGGLGFTEVSIDCQTGESVRVTGW